MAGCVAAGAHRTCEGGGCFCGHALWVMQLITACLLSTAGARELVKPLQPFFEYGASCVSAPRFKHCFQGYQPCQSLGSARVRPARRETGTGCCLCQHELKCPSLCR